MGMGGVAEDRGRRDAPSVSNLAKAARHARYWLWTRTGCTIGTTTMTRLNVSKAREEFPEVVNRAAYGKERTIVSRRGKDLAAVIPIEDLRLLERLAQEEMDRIDLEDARAALKEAEEKGTIPLRDLMRELGD
jgi:prevent-host-death family protein